jgi:hypothetical protein
VPHVADLAGVLRVLVAVGLALLAGVAGCKTSLGLESLDRVADRLRRTDSVGSAYCNSTYNVSLV